MLKDITIGQYLPGETVIHRLDPRVKILMTMFLMICLFLVHSFVFLGAIALFLIFIIRLAHIPSKILIRGLRPMVMIIVVALFFNVFFTQGETVLWEWGIIKLTEEGLRYAGFMLFRILLLVIGTSLMTLTTSPIQLTDGLEKLMSPWKKFGFPAGEIAMMMTIALRFIPLLIEEADKIMKAQKARGADFDTGSIFQRAKNMLPILIPLFVNALKRADELALAMEARCYRSGEGRTRMVELKFRKADIFILCGSLLLFIGFTYADRHYFG